ncbi:hypothetical protein IC582_024394 [Cucumis melo]
MPEVLTNPSSPPFLFGKRHSPHPSEFFTLLLSPASSPVSVSEQLSPRTSVARTNPFSIFTHPPFSSPTHSFSSPIYLSSDIHNCGPHPSNVKCRSYLHRCSFLRATHGP